MKVSILIPTHNRPKLFYRCLNSILNLISGEYEIIVNNDSFDIQEIKHNNVKYFYKNFEHLSQVYEFLLSKSNGDYVYFLEDDDILKYNISVLIDKKYDLIVGNYTTNFDVFYRFKSMSHYKDRVFDYENFISEIDSFTLQLSQFIFKRETIEHFIFPNDSHIHNDEMLVRYAAKNSNLIMTTPKIIFQQTRDGGDNISFPPKNELQYTET